MNPVFMVMNPNGMITAKSEEEITKDDHIIYDSDGAMYMDVEDDVEASGIAISSDESDSFVIYDNVFYSTSDDSSGTPVFTDMKISEVVSNGASEDFVLLTDSPAIDAGVDLEDAYADALNPNSSWTNPPATTSGNLYLANDETWDPGGFSTTVGKPYRVSFDTTTKYTDMFFGFTAFLIGLLILVAVSKLLANMLKKTHKTEDVIIYKPERLLRRLDA